MKEKPLLSILIIGFNSKPFLAHCLNGVMNQTFKQFETIFIDNNSHDDSIGFVKKKYPGVKIISNKNNKGYAGAVNQGIHLSHANYVMILNPDLILTPTYLKHAMARMGKDKKIGALTGKIRKYDFENNGPTLQIDTTGLYCYRNRRVIDRGQGRVDEGQYDRPEEVFGVSGAVPMYRRAALEDVKLPNLSKGADKGSYEFLDEDFFMYKEDVDLSWRLRLRGWKCYYEPTALAHHGRGTGAIKRFSWWEVLKGRNELSRFTKFYSYKNQRLMQVKNEQGINIIRNFPMFLAKEIAALGYILVREPYLIKAVLVFIRQLPHALKKRRLIQKRAKVSAIKMRKWLNGSARA